MSTVIDIDGKRVAIGMEWSVLSSAGSKLKSEAAAIAREQKEAFGVLLADLDDAEMRGTPQLGLFIGGVKAMGKGPAPLCGAAMLAGGNPDDAFIYIHPIDEQTVWLCAVQAGDPIPGFDTVIDVHEISALIEARGGHMPLYSPGAVVDGSIDRDFTDLTASADPVKIKRVSGTNPMLLGAVGGVVLLVAAGIGVTMFLDMQEAERQRIATQQRMAQQQAANAQQQQQALAEAKARAETKIRAEVLDKPSPRVMVDAWFSAIDSLPLTVAGWEAKKATCMLDVCEVEWARTKIGTVRSFHQEAERRQWQVGSLVGNAATTRHPFGTQARAGQLDQLPGEKEFVLDLSTALQELELADIVFTMTDPKTVELPPPPPPPPGMQPTLPHPPPPYATGDIKLAGPALFQLMESPEKTLGVPNVAFNKAVIDLTAKTWNLEGAYVVRR